MARELIQKLTDDFDGESEAVDTREYTWGGVKYIIDLNQENLDNFDDTMRAYVEVSRRADKEDRPVRTGKPAKSSKAADREKRNAIRAWAIAKGIEIGTRGRIADDIIRQYEAEMANA